MDEWRFLLGTRANVLLEGTDQAIARVVTVLTPHLKYPIEACPHWPPQVIPREGTIILRAVETLTADEQRNLLLWLDGAGSQVRLVTAVSIPLFQRVIEGKFLDMLYYRLNTLYITADDALSIGGAD
jgi:sigma-54-interacting transcriptional regulator